MKACIWAGSVILISASTSVSFTSRGELTNAIFASLTSEGIPGCTLSLSTITPSTKVESSTTAPSFFSILMLSVSTTPSSATFWTASTINFANGSRAASVPLPVIAVIATLVKVSSSTESIAISSKISCAFSAACLYPIAMMVGWISWSNKDSDFFNNSPAIITAVVVPSPTSSSWVLATSTNILAAGCSISISFKIVTPSLVTTISPSPSTNILSIPFGPNVVLTVSASTFPAKILFLWASLPTDLFVPSGKIKIGCPPCAIIITF